MTYLLIVTVTPVEIALAVGFVLESAIIVWMAVRMRHVLRHGVKTRILSTDETSDYDLGYIGGRRLAKATGNVDDRKLVKCAYESWERVAQTTTLDRGEFLRGMLDGYDDHKELKELA